MTAKHGIKKNADLGEKSERFLTFKPLLDDLIGLNVRVEEN